MTGTGEQVLFWVLGPISVLAALGLLFAKKAVHAAIGVALVMINLGIFYIAEQADFLGIIQIFVYTGAVIMLFLFVLMLVGVDSSDSLVETIKGQKWVSLAAGLRPRRAHLHGHRLGPLRRHEGPDRGQQGHRQRHRSGRAHLRTLRLGLRGDQRRC